MKSHLTVGKMGVGEMETGETGVGKMGTSRQRVIQCTHRGTCKIGLILKMKRNVVIVAL